MTWEEYYEKINEWSTSTAVSRLSSLQDFGPEDEIVDAINILACDDEKGATRLLKKAINAGVKFSSDNLAEIYELCDEDAAKAAVYASASTLSASDLEMLCANVDEEVIRNVATTQNLPLPEDLRDEESEEENLTSQISAAISAADYAVECLTRAQAFYNASGSISIADMLSKNSLFSFMKFSSLKDSENELIGAIGAVEALNQELACIKKNSIKVASAKLSSAIDIWFDSGLLDCLVHTRIRKIQKNIRRAIFQIEAIKRELTKLK